MQSSPDYNSFWLVYLAAHRRPTTRAIHMTGTAASILLVLAALAFRDVWFLAAAAIAGWVVAVVTGSLSAETLLPILQANAAPDSASAAISVIVPISLDMAGLLS